jgi:hypothetical protein
MTATTWRSIRPASSGRLSAFAEQARRERGETRRLRILIALTATAGAVALGAAVVGLLVLGS